ncbi:unnamed protein product [Symbiodinium sp. CCMP2592]|nr:unnamed protein product [Symbiodinium sp. CCMP2592]
MRWAHLGQRIGSHHPSPQLGSLVEVCSAVAQALLGRDVGVTGTLIQDRCSEQSCLVEFEQVAHLVPYAGITKVGTTPCTHFPRLSAADLAVIYYRGQTAMVPVFSAMHRASQRWGLGHLQQADARTLFDFFQAHHYELGSFVDLHTTTVCAGSTGSVDILIVDHAGTFTEVGEDALQRLTAGTTRPTGPLLVASPTHCWGILAALELHSTLYDTLLTYPAFYDAYGAPRLNGPSVPCEDQTIEVEFYQKWSVNIPPNHADACAVLVWARTSDTLPAQLLLRQPDQWVKRRPFLPVLQTEDPIMATLERKNGNWEWRIYRPWPHVGEHSPPKRAYGALLRHHNRTLIGVASTTTDATSATSRTGENPAFVAPLPGLFYLCTIASEHAAFQLRQGLQQRAYHESALFAGENIAVVHTDKLTMASSATYDPKLGRAIPHRLHAPREPDLVAEIRTIGCTTDTAPPQVNWEEEITTLLNELRHPLAPIYPSLPGLAARQAPPDNVDEYAEQRMLLQNWLESSSRCQSEITAPAASAALDEFLPSERDCITLLSLPQYLQSGEVRLNKSNFGAQIIDFADRALRIRACTQEEAWRLTIMPVVAMACALAQFCSPVQSLSERQAVDLSWYALANPRIWLWLLLDEFAALEPTAATLNTATRSEVRDGSLIVTALSGTQAATQSRLRLQFPNISVASINRVELPQGFFLEVRLDTSFLSSQLCPLQSEVGRRIVEAFEQGRVLMQSPPFNPSIFTHPANYSGRLRVFLPVEPRALGLEPTSLVPIQPSGLLASALARLRARTTAGAGFDVPRICAMCLRAPRPQGLYYPMRFHRLGGYTLTGRMAALVANNLRSLPNDHHEADAIRLGATLAPGSWQELHRRFLEEGGLHPGLDANVHFLSKDICPDLFERKNTPFYTDRQLRRLYPGYNVSTMLMLNDEHMEDPNQAWARYLDRYVPTPDAEEPPHRAARHF